MAGDRTYPPAIRLSAGTFHFLSFSTARTVLVARWATVLLMLCGTLVLCTTADRGHTASLFFGFSLLVAGWLLSLLLPWSGKDLYRLLVFSLFCRAVWMLFPPLLSDDWARYLWDGMISHSGGNPFEALPSAIPGNSEFLFQAMNSPDYYSVYPPLAQVIFHLAYRLGEPLQQIWGVPGMVLFLRAILLLGDALAIGLLLRLLPSGQENRVLFYALAPLALLETSANIHLEGLAIAFILLGSYGIQRLEKTRRASPASGVTIFSIAWWWVAAFGFAAAILIKLHPVLLLLLLPFRLGWRKGLVLAATVGILVWLAFLPYLSPTVMANVSQSLDLYFRTFEFNGSIYLLARWLGTLWFGYNPIALIGPLLAVLAAAIILFRAFRYPARDTVSFWHSLFWIAAVHVLFATIVHPWYLLPLLAWSCFSAYRFGLIWSVLVLLTYAAYSGGGFHHPYALIAVEYGIVFSYLLWELVERRKNPGLE